MKRFTFLNLDSEKEPEESEKKFYKKKSFWAVFFGTLGGIIAGDAGAMQGVLQLFSLIFGGN